MAGRAWLFVRGDDCVWLQRVSEDDCLLRMHGPGTHRDTYTFASADALLAFVATAEERLLSTGWTCQQFAPGEDRRHDVAGARPSVERRRFDDTSV